LTKSAPFCIKFNKDIFLLTYYIIIIVIGYINCLYSFIIIYFILITFDSSHHSLKQFDKINKDINMLIFNGNIIFGLKILVLRRSKYIDLDSTVGSWKTNLVVAYLYDNIKHMDDQHMVMFDLRICPVILEYLVLVKKIEMIAEWLWLRGNKKQIHTF
jgi:hypothetical protein